MGIIRDFTRRPRCAALGNRLRAASQTAFRNSDYSAKYISTRISVGPASVCYGRSLVGETGNESARFQDAKLIIVHAFYLAGGANTVDLDKVIAGCHASGRNRYY